MKFVPRYLTMLLFAVLLAGCGGGGGGAGSTLQTTSTPGSSTTTPIQTTAVQRALAQQVLTSTNDSSTIAQYGASSSSTGAVAAMRRTLSDGRARESTSTCIDGTTTTTTPGSSSNVESISVSSYYDANCTDLWFTGQFTATIVSSTLVTATGEYTYYTQAGAEYEYAGPVTLTLSAGNPAYFSALFNVATSATASPYVTVGVGCSIASTSDSCSIAGAQHLSGLNLDDAVALDLAATLQSGASGQTIGLNGTGSASTGALDSISVINQGTYVFGITGGSVVDTATLAGSFNLSGSGLVSGGSLTLTDAADHATATATYNAATQTIVGSITQTGTNAVVATYSVSLNGSGTITYSNGSTGTITNWVVLT